MNILCIDIGSYSIKFLSGNIDRKNFEINSFKKIEVNSLIDQPTLDELEDPEQYQIKLEERSAQLLSTQFSVISDYIEETGFEGKIILSLPAALITTRFLELPVQSKKKAELMVPFQLEGNLPFSMSDTHWTASYYKVDTAIQAQVYISKLDEFDNFFSKLSFANLEPAILAPPMSFWQATIPELGMQGQSLVIDFGHDMVSAYHLINQRIVSNHTSYYAGKAMDEFMAHTFSLDMEQVSELKHENAKILLKDEDDESEAAEYTEAEKSMDLMLKQFLYPSMREIKRWLIGHQVKFNAQVEVIYLTGGLSNLPGLKEFLEENFHIPVRDIEFRGLPFILPTKIYTKEFGLCLAMAQSQVSKMSTANFLKGQFQSNFQSTIPLTSSTFVFTRAMILALILCSFMLVEKFVLLDPKLKDAVKQSQKAVKDQNMALNKSQQKRIRNRPDSVLKIVDTKVAVTKKDYENLKDASTYNAFDGIFKLAKIIGENDNIELLELSNVDQEITALIASKKEDEINKLKEYLSYVGLSNLQLKDDGDRLRIITK